MNVRGIAALYKMEMVRAFRTVGQTIASPVISTVLYFIVFGAAMGTNSNLHDIDGVTYGAFIVPGLVMMTVLTQSLVNASFSIYFPRFTGTIYEVLSAPLSFLEVVVAYIGGAATKSVIIGTIVLITAHFFVSFDIIHPFWMIFFFASTCITFSLLGFIIGVWADGFEQLQLIPLLVVTPLTFLGGTFYSIGMLPPFWQKFSLINPVVYLISGFRWSFYGGHADVKVALSVGMISVFMIICLVVIAWIFKTGYRIRN